MRKLQFLIIALTCVCGSFKMYSRDISGSINVLSGPSVRVPGITIPTVLGVTCQCSPAQLRWERSDGVEIGTGTSLSVSVADTYKVWEVKITAAPGEPVVENYDFVAQITILNLDHKIKIGEDRPPQINESEGNLSLSVNSNAFTEYSAQIKWWRDSWDLGTSAPTITTPFSGAFRADVTYTYQGQSITISTPVRNILPSIRKPFLQQPVGAYNPVMPPVLAVTNLGDYNSYTFIRDNQQIAVQESNVFTVPGPGRYRVGGRLRSNGLVAFGAEFVIAASDVVTKPPITATNNGILLYEGPGLELSTLIGYERYNWFREGVAIAGATSNTVTVTTPGSYSVEGCVGIQCVTSDRLQIVGETLHINYVTKKTALIEGVTSTSQFDQLPGTQKNQHIAYVDGFVRPLLDVQREASSQGKDIVLPHKYDKFGREVKKFLPINRNTTDGSYRYIPNSLGPITDYYQQGNDRIANTSVPFAETLFEGSPLNRVLKQGAPGEEWQLSGTHAVVFRYTTNRAADNIWIWAPSGSNLSSTAFYPDGSLTVIESTDENGNLSREFKNKNDQTILTEKIIESGVKLRTYFVFDDMGRLTHVIPPKTVAELPTSASVTLASDVMAKECFSYSYDERGRVTVKNIPGGGATYIVYDQWDRAVLTQHANQRAKSKWSFNKFDAFNRVIMSGEITLAGTNVTATNAITSFYTTVASNPNLRYEDIGGTIHGYTNRSFPVLANQFQVYTASYYDDYNFLSHFGTGYQFVPEMSLGLTANSSGTKGLLTGLKVIVLGTQNYLRTSNFYDKKHRLIQVVTDNHLNGIDRTSNALDFTGKILKVKSVHNGLQAITVDQEFTYDPQGRKQRVFHTINNGPKILLCEYHYNELGQMVEKNMHSTDGDTFLQSLDYAYNIRGWVSQVNPAETESNVKYQDQYGFELLYNTPPAVTTGFEPSFNGNIAAFSQARSASTSTYIYRYDARDQLIRANYYQPSKDGHFDMPEITYDPNGNIKTLKRKGGANASGTPVLIDDLIYTYMGNQLIGVEDRADKLKGFVDK